MLEVLKSGGEIQIIDSGRVGYRRFGVPVSGAMDLISANRAHSILGNPTTLPLLEIYLPGHEFVFHKQAFVALTGANTRCEINRSPVSMNSVHKINPNDILALHQMYHGSRVYLSILGGFDVPKILNSYSPIPGPSNIRIVKGTRIEYKEHSEIDVPHSTLSGMNVHTEFPIDCFKGPEWRYLNNDQKQQVLDTKWIINKLANRMGLRTDGRKVDGQWQSEIYSSAVLPGTVQLLPTGKPLILMRDCQTTGGYPRILQISEYSINYLGQRRPGDSIQFRMINS